VCVCVCVCVLCDAGLKEVDEKLLRDHNAIKKEIDEELERQFPLHPSNGKKGAPNR